MAIRFANPRDEVETYVVGLGNRARQDDARRLIGVGERATGLDPAMWGRNLVGFGSWTCRYESGRSGHLPVFGFMPRGRTFAIYLYDGDLGEAAPLLACLGPVVQDGRYLYVGRLADIRLDVLEQILRTMIAVRGGLGLA